MYPMACTSTDSRATMVGGHRGYPLELYLFPLVAFTLTLVPAGLSWWVDRKARIESSGPVAAKP